MTHEPDPNCGRCGGSGFIVIGGGDDWDEDNCPCTRAPVPSTDRMTPTRNLIVTNVVREIGE